jgi:trimeric autotransporter adhesin
MKAQPAVNDADANAAELVRSTHLDIINTIQHDPVLQALAVSAQADANGVHPFGFTPAPPADGMPAAQMPGNTFAEIGQIFDDAQNLSLAGVNATNKDAFVADLTTARDDMVKLIKTGIFTGETLVHADKIVNCFNLELDKVVPEYGNNPDAARETNDIFLDLTDVVTADNTLTAMSTDPNGVHGWTPAPHANQDPIMYQDNADQTNFLAGVIAGSNTLGTQAEAIAQQGFNPGLVKAFEHILNGFETNVQQFIEKQGGIYEARFDNELEGNFGTIGAAIKGIEQGLNTHNADLVTAGVNVLEANAADVGGNNIPLGGGTYTSTATTAAGAATGAVDTHLVPHGDNGIAQAIGVGGAANTQPVPHGDLVGLLQAMTETADVAGNNAPMGGGNGAAAGAVNTHLILQAMTGTADVAGNDAPMGGENGAVAGAVDTHLVPHGGNGIDHAVGAHDHLHHALTENAGLFHG